MIEQAGRVGVTEARPFTEEQIEVLDGEIASLLREGKKEEAVARGVQAMRDQGMEEQYLP